MTIVSPPKAHPRATRLITLKNVLGASRNALQFAACEAARRAAVGIEAAGVRVSCVVAIRRNATSSRALIVVRRRMIDRHREVHIRAQILVGSVLPSHRVHIGSIVRIQATVGIVLTGIACRAIGMCPAQGQAVLREELLAYCKPVT